jgi:hypothetical protein
MDNTALIPPSMVDSWNAIEELGQSRPMEWFTLDQLLEAMPAGNEKSQYNLVRLLARSAVLRSEGRRGHRKYRLSDVYTVGVYLTSRTLADLAREAREPSEDGESTRSSTVL